VSRLTFIPHTDLHDARIERRGHYSEDRGVDVLISGPEVGVIRRVKRVHAQPELVTLADFEFLHQAKVRDENPRTVEHTPLQSSDISGSGIEELLAFERRIPVDVHSGAIIRIDRRL